MRIIPDLKSNSKYAAAPTYSFFSSFSGWYGSLESITCSDIHSPVTSERRMSGCRPIPVAWKASWPPSSRSRIVMQAATSQPISIRRVAAFSAEPPVVVTSSNNTTRSPSRRVEPSIPGGFPVLRPPRPLASLRTRKPRRSEPLPAFAIAMPVRGTAPNSSPPTASTPPIESISAWSSTPIRWAHSGFIITGFMSKKCRLVLPLASVNSSVSDLNQARSRTFSTNLPLASSTVVDSPILSTGFDALTAAHQRCAGRLLTSDYISGLGE